MDWPCGQLPQDSYWPLLAGLEQLAHETASCLVAHSCWSSSLESWSSSSLSSSAICNLMPSVLWPSSKVSEQGMWPYCGYCQLHKHIWPDIYGSARKLYHPLNNCKSHNLSFQVSVSELRCKGYKRSKWRFPFSSSDHISSPNCQLNLAWLMYFEQIVQSHCNTSLGVHS